MGPEPALGYVRRAVGGMVYADDACIISSAIAAGARSDDRSHRRDLPSLRLNHVCEKTETMYIIHRVHRGRWRESKQSGKSANS